jgi:hypothetical protein
MDLEPRTQRLSYLPFQHHLHHTTSSLADTSSSAAGVGDEVDSQLSRRDIVSRFGRATAAPFAAVSDQVAELIQCELRSTSSVSGVLEESAFGADVSLGTGDLNWPSVRIQVDIKRPGQLNAYLHQGTTCLEGYDRSLSRRQTYCEGLQVPRHGSDRRERCLCN